MRSLSHRTSLEESAGFPPRLLTGSPGLTLTPEAQSQLVWGTAQAGGLLEAPWGIFTCS